MAKYCVVFGGQGQPKPQDWINLAAAYPDQADAVWGTVHKATGISLLDFDPHLDDQTSIIPGAILQPGLLANGMTALRVLEHLSGKRLCDIGEYVAGHSLGQWIAATAAECFDLSEGARLLNVRGHSMDEYTPDEGGSMIPVIGTLEDVEEAISESTDNGAGDDIDDDTSSSFAIACKNGAVQILSGAHHAVSALVDKLKVNGFKTGIPLRTRTPMHTRYMIEVQRDMRTALASVDVHRATVPLICNTDGRIVTKHRVVVKRLIDAIVMPVDWEHCIETMKSHGVTGILELGTDTFAKPAKRLGLTDSVALVKPGDFPPFINKLTS